MDDKKAFDDALKRRQDVWNRQSKEMAKEFAVCSMKLRRVYKSVKNVVCREYNLVASDDTLTMEYSIPDADVPLIRSSGEYVYFGLVVQYGRPESNEMKYEYYVQGYIVKNQMKIDYNHNSFK